MTRAAIGRRDDFLRTRLALTGLGMVVAAFAAPTTVAGQSLAYTWTMTPEEGPPDPAVEARQTPESRACRSNARTNLDGIRCYEAEFVSQDAALNARWRAALARTPSIDRPALVAAERAWVAERDRYCRSVEAGFGDGSIAPLVFADCRVEQTIRRTLWLDGRHADPAARRAQRRR